MGFKKNNVKNTLSRQDENWELMTVLGVPWTECDKISNEDREYLLDKATKIKLEVERQNEERRSQEKEYADKIVANAKPNPDSSEPPMVKLGANY
jgi:hypothetical protein